MIHRLIRPAAVFLTLAVVVLPAWGAKPKTKDEPVKPGVQKAEGVAARVGDASISFEELDRRARTANLQAYQQLYDARRAVLEELIADTLFDAEAKARGITRDELIDLEITKKIVVADDAAIEKFYNENQARMGGRTLEDVGPQIRAYLDTESANAARQGFIDRLRAKTPVEIRLDPPRAVVEVAANDPGKGPADAPLQIVLFSEFQ